MSEVRIDAVRRERDGQIQVLYSRRRADGEFGKGPDKTGVIFEAGVDAAKLRAQAQAMIPTECLVMLAVADYLEAGEVEKSLDSTVVSIGELSKAVEAVALGIKR